MKANMNFVNKFKSLGFSGRKSPHSGWKKRARKYIRAIWEV